MIQERNTEFSSSPNQPPPIWLVDDDPDDQYLLQYAFKHALPQISTKLLSDGVELLEALRQAPTLPKLVLLDLNMPRKNGFETLQDLRCVPDCQHMPVVVLTTSDSQEDKEKVLQLGANDFLTKAATQIDIIQVVKQLAIKWQLIA